MLFLDAKEFIDYHSPEILVEHWILVVGSQGDSAQNMKSLLPS